MVDKKVVRLRAKEKADEFAWFSLYLIWFVVRKLFEVIVVFVVIIWLIYMAYDVTLSIIDDVNKTQIEFREIYYDQQKRIGPSDS